MIAEILFCVFLFSVIVQFGYIFRIFSFFFSPAEKYSIHNPKPVSIIICARNEAENLRQNLPAILAQRYTNDSGNPLFEVIVIDDGSQDDTAQALAEMSLQYPHLRYVHIPVQAERRLPGKKAALSKGVSMAAHNFLLMTDADCSVQSEYWLQYMVAPLHNGKSIAAGYGKFKETQGWLNAFIRWETMHTFLQYSSYALAGWPYMAVGRNIACVRDVFIKAQNAAAWSKLPSGDDDLLINIAGSRHNIAIVSHPGAFTVSDAKATYPEWFTQKQRHLSTGKYYRTANIFLVGGYAVVHALTWLLFLLLLCIGDREAVFIAMLLRSITIWVMWYEAGRRTQEQNLAAFFPLMDIGWMIYNFAFSPYVFWKNKRQWK